VGLNTRWITKGKKNTDSPAKMINIRGNSVFFWICVFIIATMLVHSNPLEK
jgi:hypothetical protein